LIVSFAIAPAHRNSRACVERLDRDERSQKLRASMRAMQNLLARARVGVVLARAVLSTPDMTETKYDAWSITLLVILATSWLVGIIMIMAVVLMH
jgi:hypothetical protein